MCQRVRVARLVTDIPDKWDTARAHHVRGGFKNHVDEEINARKAKASAWAARGNNPAISK